ncbi:MAG: L-threonylcarbamoyladenylate synthase [candidate division WOR-3 bacterium]|nr:L-threonylcarbamoyladenylate synthase [candidate division WOR-3 bacterium]
MIIKLAEAFNSLRRITQILENKGIIAIPTDTVYGLAVDGGDEAAVRKLFDTKQREERPFTLFISRGDIDKFAVPVKKKIIDFFVPGPLTIIVKKKSDISLPYITDKIGIRIPQNDFVLKLLAEYRRPLAVSSVNKSGEPPMISPYDIIEHFTEVGLVVDGGMLYSPPSTVLDLTATPPMVMRKGAVPILAIEKVYGRRVTLKASLKFNVLFVCSGNTCRSPMAEGMLKTLINPKYCEVRSAGTIAMGGLQSAHYARQVVKEYGGSIDRHRSNYLDRELIDWADLVLVMEFKHYETVLEINPDAVVRTFLLREYRRKTKYTEVPDPVGRDLVAYQQAAVKMYPTLKRLAKDIEARFRGRR